MMISKTEKRPKFFTFCKSVPKFVIAMIFVAASACSAQKSNWYLFQPNNQGINVEFGNASCSQGANFLKPIKQYTKQTFKHYLAVKARTDKKGNILFYLLVTLDSVYLSNAR